MSNYIKNLWNRIKKLFKSKYDVVVIDPHSLEKKKEFVYKPAFLILSLVGIFSFFLLLVLFTILRYGIANPIDLLDGQVSEKKEIEKLRKKIFESEKKLDAYNKHIENVKKTVLGAPIELDTVVREISEIEFPKLFEDTVKPSKVVEQFAKNIKKDSIAIDYTLLFYSPTKGYITQHSDEQLEHIAVDIASKNGEKVVAVTSGVVIYVGEDENTGKIIVIQHKNGFVSVYKHCGTILKEIGEFVTEQQEIATVGNTGKLSTGPHLHFELWKDAKAVNPQDYIDFK